MEFVEKLKKVVTFSPFVEVCYIPRKEEYAHIKALLWYRKYDYMLFLRDSKRFVF